MAERLMLDPLTRAFDCCGSAHRTIEIRQKSVDKKRASEPAKDPTMVEDIGGRRSGAAIPLQRTDPSCVAGAMTLSWIGATPSIKDPDTVCAWTSPAMCTWRKAQR